MLYSFFFLIIGIDLVMIVMLYDIVKCDIVVSNLLVYVVRC